MTVVEVSRRVGYQGGEQSEINSLQVVSTRTESYDVTTTIGTSQTEVLASLQIPQIKSPHPDGSLLRVVNRRADQITPILFRVDCEYETPPFKPGQNPDQNSPLALGAEIDFDSDETEEDIDIDADGNPIIMVTREEFRPKLRDLVQTDLITITKPVATVSMSLLSDYRNKTNSATYIDMPPGTLLMRKLKATSTKTDDWHYFTLQAVIAYRSGASNHTTDAKAWYRRVLAQGYYCRLKIAPLIDTRARCRFKGRVSDVPMPHRIYKDDGSPADPSGTAGVDLLGEQLPDGTPEQWYLWKLKKSIDFNGLRLLDGQ